MGLERAPAQVSSMDRALVLGGTGFVGRELAEYLRCPTASLSGGGGSIAVDARHLADLRTKVGQLAPQTLVNCVGLADVDLAERDPELADSLNRRVVDNLVRIQPEMGFRLIHISTDYVFDGQRGGYQETDPPNPINEYGRSKLRGEEVALGSNGSLVVRISSPYGRGFGVRKPQFFRYVTEALRSGKAVKALTDQRVTATFLPDLASAIETLSQRSVAGLVHVASAEAMTRFEFARQIARVVGADPELVTPGLRSDMKQWMAPRPADTSLNIELSEGHGVSYTPVETALRSLLTVGPERKAGG